MKKYQYYLFDFDGTLVDSFPSLYIVFQRAFKAIEIDINPNDVPWMSRVPITESYEHYNGPQDDEHIEIFIKAINDALDSHDALVLTRLFYDSKDFFNYIKENNIKCGIVTSNNKRHVKDVLNFCGIDPSIFKVIVGNEECNAIKPDPDPLFQALKLLDYKGDINDVIYIGDSLNDCLAAKNANMPTLLVDRGDAPKDSEYQTINSLMELFE